MSTRDYLARSAEYAGLADMWLDDMRRTRCRVKLSHLARLYVEAMELVAYFTNRAFEVAGGASC